MLKCGRMELNVTLSQQLKKVFFAFLSNTHTEIQLGIVGLDVGVLRREKFQRLHKTEKLGVE